MCFYDNVVSQGRGQGQDQLLLCSLQRLEQKVCTVFICGCRIAAA